MGNQGKAGRRKAFSKMGTSAPNERNRSHGSREENQNKWNSHMSLLESLERRQQRLERELAENTEALQEELLFAIVRGAVDLQRHAGDRTPREVREFYWLSEKVTDRSLQPIAHAANMMVAEAYGGQSCMEKE